MILKFNVKDTASVPREKEDGQTRKMKQWLENKVSVYFKTVKMSFFGRCASRFGHKSDRKKTRSVTYSTDLKLD